VGQKFAKIPIYFTSSQMKCCGSESWRTFCPLGQAQSEPFPGSMCPQAETHLGFLMPERCPLVSFIVTLSDIHSSHWLPAALLHLLSRTQAHIAEVLIARSPAQGNSRKCVYMLAFTRTHTYTAGVVVAGALVVIALTVALTWWYWNKCQSKVHVCRCICVGARASVLMFVSRY
jgi:hypothetical protein